MQYKIDWIEDKNKDWKVVTIVKDGLPITGVSINRLSKKNEVFPGFDSLMPGGFVEGELWQSTAGKWYLFGPKLNSPRGGAPRASSTALEAAKIVGKNVEKAQDRKEESFKTNSTFTAAWTTALAMWQEQRRTSVGQGDSYEKLFEEKREFFWNRYDVSDSDFNPPQI